MKYYYLKVMPQLTEYIRTVLILDGHSDSENSPLPLLTNSMPALICRIDDQNIEVTLFGKSVPGENWVIKNPDQQIVAFFFKPFSIGPVFKLSARELKKRPAELNRWNAQKAIALNLQLLHSKSTKEKVDVLSRFILNQIQHNQRECGIIQYATDKLMQDPSPDSLSKLPNELHLTERTLQRIFKKYTGIAPNEYRRICQFYFAFSQLKGGNFDKLIDIVYASGYFDQSHFIRAFKEFTELTPNDYLKFGLNRKSE